MLLIKQCNVSLQWEGLLKHVVTGQEPQEGKSQREGSQAHLEKWTRSRAIHRSLWNKQRDTLSVVRSSARRRAENQRAQMNLWPNRNHLILDCATTYMGSLVRAQTKHPTWANINIQKGSLHMWQESLTFWQQLQNKWSMRGSYSGKIDSPWYICAWRKNTKMSAMWLLRIGLLGWKPSSNSSSSSWDSLRKLNLGFKQLRGSCFSGRPF